MPEKREIGYEELKRVTGGEGKLDFNYKHVTLHIKYSYIENGVTKEKTDDVLIEYKSGRTHKDDEKDAKKYCENKGYTYISVTHTFK